MDEMRLVPASAAAARTVAVMTADLIRWALFWGTASMEAIQWGGTGTLSYATKIIPAGDTIVLENFGTQPVMLTEIKSESHT
jgi:hypothetical protein